jgi:tetratricopeptide (TPR) repeat protein
MVIDGRHDHSFRVPRPDLSLAVGSPNACTQCHRDRKPEWAVAAMNKWYGETWRDRPHYGPTLHAGAKEGVKAVPALLELARDPASPAIVRASAATLAQPHVRPTHLPAVRSLLQDADPSVRVAALGLLEPFDPAVRAQAAAPLLADPIRGVRIEAARALAEVPEGQLVPDQRGAREVALKEYVEALRRDADWPAANVNLGNLRLRQGRPEEAIAAYEHALALDPRFVGAYVNLADASRRQGREGDGERVLRRGLSVLPRAADLHHVLGLLLVRKGDQAAALRELATAVKLAPENTRFAYVYAVGLHSTAKRGEALTVLREAARRQPYDLDVLSALVSMNREAGNSKAALAYARRLADVMPDDAGVRRLVADLEGTK